MFTARSRSYGYRKEQVETVKCLVVDNEPAIRRLITAVLAPLSPQIFECADGAGALAAFEKHRPDVVLMDLAMAAVDGLTATAALIARHPSARVYIVTNFDGADLRAAATSAGASGYVLKENLLELLPLVAQLQR